MHSDQTIAVLENRLIAFLDVLGFASRLANESPAELVHVYCGFIDEANSKVFSPINQLDKGERVSNFAASKFVFDSIILVSHPIDDQRNVSNFIFAVTLLLENGFSKKFPLRGSISTGDYIESNTNGVFVSPEFKELFRFEQALAWSGCCVLPKAETVVLNGLHGHQIEVNKVRRNHPVVNYMVPFNNETQNLEMTESLWVLNWCYMLSTNEIAEGLNYLIPAKQNPTAKFVDFVKALPGTQRDIVTGHQPPLYIRNMPSITQCRIRFTNEQDESADPQMEVHIAFEAEL